jgi:hypothetical protein
MKSSVPAVLSLREDFRAYMTNSSADRLWKIKIFSFLDHK